MDNIEEKLYLILRMIRKNENVPNYDILNDTKLLHLCRNDIKRLIGIAACEGLIEEPDFINARNGGRTVLNGKVKITEKGYKFLKTYLVR